MSVNVDKARRELQLGIVDAIKAAGYNGVAISPTGSGKAFVLIECLKRLKPKGRIFYLCESQINRDKTFKEELIKWEAEEWIEKIEFLCYQTAYKLENQEVELCLADECDFIAHKYKRAFTHNKFKHIVAVSATLTEEKRKLIESIVPIVYEVGLQEIEEKGLLNKTRYHEVNFLLTPKENLVYLQMSRNFAQLLNDGKANKWKLEMLKIKRGHFLASLESSKRVCKRLIEELLKDVESRIIIFTGLSSQADAVCEHSYHSKSTENNLIEFHEGRIRALSVVGKVTRGVNIGAIGSKGISSPVSRIIFEAPQRSATKFLQKSGRGRRLKNDSVLDVYFCIPFFKNNYGKIMSTIVSKWVKASTESIDYKPIKYNFKD